MFFNSAIRAFSRLLISGLSSPSFLLSRGTRSRQSKLFRCRLLDTGNNNHIDIRNADLEGCSFQLMGNNLSITIEGGHYHNVEFWMEDDGSKILIGSGTSMEGGHVAAIEGKSIIIGQNCLFSHSLVIANSDSHSILSGGVRINPAKDINIGSHCWAGRNVTILKGVSIAEDCIIGANSTVTHDLTQPHSIYAGSPASLVRDNISWEKERI